MANRLAGEISPYLLQHADNPVDWHPWGTEALALAEAQDKPIFLSIGYAACHWCHVMAHESFEDPETAALMNKHFVNIKVDREERPDLDSLYMDAVVAMTGQGGWPMSVFLTPEGKPFYGGTYFPPNRRFNLPSFRELLLGLAEKWQEDRSGVRKVGEELSARVGAAPALLPREAELDESLLQPAAEALFRTFDWDHGGWGRAPKFPQPMAVEFLLRRHARGGDRLALDMATKALRSMAMGGIFDHLGGGFARLIPSDQPLIVQVLNPVGLEQDPDSGRPIFRIGEGRTKIIVWSPLDLDTELLLSLAPYASPAVGREATLAVFLVRGDHEHRAVRLAAEGTPLAIVPLDGAREVRVPLPLPRGLATVVMQPSPALALTVERLAIRRARDR